MFKRDPLYLFALAILTLMVLAWAAWQDMQPEYLGYQQRFRRLVAERLGPEKAAKVAGGVQQVWIPSANRVDRCMTCHLGVSWAGLEDAEEPFRTHPPEPLKNHPIERFGCTFCHGGQGSSTKKKDAHGWIKHWEDPLLDTKLAEDYQVKDPWAFLQIKCNSCHRYDRETEGADYINKAKRLVGEKGCRACHTINERGGTIGPDLTHVGDKSPEQYDYTRLTTFASVFNWQIGHMQDPKAFAPDTIMPDFGFDSDASQALGMLLMSWRDTELPAEFIHGAQIKDLPTPEEAERERIMREGEGKFFVEKTCFICHDVSSLGILSATKIGPDLAIAEDDVPRRFGRTLEDFLHNPSGTMAVVLSKQIHLSPEEVDEAIKLLKVANQKYKQQKQAAATAATPTPEGGAQPAASQQSQPAH